MIDNESPLFKVECTIRICCLSKELVVVMYPILLGHVTHYQYCEITINIGGNMKMVYQECIIIIRCTIILLFLLMYVSISVTSIVYLVCDKKDVSGTFKFLDYNTENIYVSTSRS